MIEQTTEVATAPSLLRLVRPKQWVKNALVAAPLVFSGSFLRVQAVERALAAILLFTVASCAVYVLNDLIDAESDRCHPLKSLTRPIACGAVSVAQARLLLGALWTVVAGSAFYDPRLAGALVLYILLNVAYSVRLKHVPVVDLFILASGFVLRVYGGAVAIRVHLSFWMFITTLCLALYLACGKRRQELVKSGTKSRVVLREYTAPLLDSYSSISEISAIVFYGLFVSTTRPALAITMPFVLFGLFRYRYLVEVRSEGENPTEVLWSDIPLMLCVLFWAATSIYVLLPR